MLTYLARDCNTNETFHLFTDDPLKELLEKFDRKTSEPMCVDSKDGNKTFHTGWIIASRWLQVYKVTEMRIEQCQQLPVPIVDE